VIKVYKQNKKKLNAP